MKWTTLLLASMAATLPALASLQPLPAAGDETHAAVAETREQRDARMQWWREAKFGLFVHYGLYSGLGGVFRGQPGGAEWIQRNLELDTETYAGEASKYFVPAEGCTEEWAALAREAGCRYMVLTTKHHDGFALFRTQMSDFSAPELVGRDLVREYVDSCRRHGLRVGFYHSVIDWHHPAYDDTICPDLCYPAGQRELLRQRKIPRDQEAYIRYLHAQVRELLSQYGPVSVMWWDYSQGAAEGQRAWRAPELISMCREMQPGVIMNNRLYAFSGFDASRDTVQLDLRCGDYTTPEKRIPEAGYPGTDWEACMTIGDKWGYNRFDTRLKSPAVIIRQLQECVAKGGNLLLNIGPMGDGRVPTAQADVLRRVGAWMRVNGASVYGSEPLRGIPLPDGWRVARGKAGEVLLFAPPVTEVAEVILELPAQLVQGRRVTVLGQPDCSVRVEPVVESTSPGESPASVRLLLPGRIWSQAVEGLPVFSLSLQEVRCPLPDRACVRVPSSPL